MIRKEGREPDDFVVQFQDDTRLVLLEKKPRRLIRDVIIPIRRKNNGKD